MKISFINIDQTIAFVALSTVIYLLSKKANMPTM